MPLWFWFLMALATGLVLGVESWAWMRHRKSAIGLAVAGSLSLGIMLVIGFIAVTVVLGAVAGVTGLDPLGLDSPQASTAKAGSGGGACDPNYKGACLDPNASDYDCAGGSGDGPEYTGSVQVVGDDHFGLDRDGDGYACE